MAEAGYADGFDVVIEGRPDAYGFDKEIMTALAEYLKMVGVNATVEYVESGLFWEKAEVLTASKD